MRTKKHNPGGSFVFQLAGLVVFLVIASEMCTSTRMWTDKLLEARRNDSLGLFEIEKSTTVEESWRVFR